MLFKTRKKFCIYFLFFCCFCKNVTFVCGQDVADEISADFLSKIRKKEADFSGNSFRINSCTVNSDSESLTIQLSNKFEGYPYRPATIQEFYDSLKVSLPDSLSDYTLSIKIKDNPIEDYVPNFFRDKKDIDEKRQQRNDNPTPIVRNTDKPYKPSKGLTNRHLALWNSHGYYYEPSKNTWEWQRPRLYTIVEDSYTTSVMLPYLVPMLENAGAYVFLPRERDVQTREIIVDNDDVLSANFSQTNSDKDEWESDSSGFANKKIVYIGTDNPFRMGTFQKIKTRKNGNASIRWIPTIPKDGDYGVYISYKSLDNSVSDATYTVYHTGGQTRFKVNQKMGGSTWIYLGTFRFKKGRDGSKGMVELTNSSKHSGIVTADAVRFGGGMGNIGRYPDIVANDSVIADSMISTSQMPRFLEGARYWLQWAGYPDSIYDINKGQSEYKDDFMSRGQWVNCLTGGSYRLPERNGKRVPIDLAMALHTDAGIADSSIVGSLAIYMTNKNGEYANGQRRIASRDLADLIQTQTVADIRAVFDKNWTRRKLTDESYYEARVPETPTMLFEVLSHQNFYDMKYALEPRFRFLLARSIYKGILKFVSSQYNVPYQVQPLPVKNFGIEFFNETENQVFLSWQENPDTLESTAAPDKYILYTAIDNNGFDNGKIIMGNHTVVNINPGKIYRFKITALNDGGESFPSEILCVAKAAEEKGKALIVNCFDKVSAPTSFENENFHGFLWDNDPGMPDIRDISFTGRQYDFDVKSVFVDNENPGIGASQSDYEKKIIAGNSFNYPYIHGKSILDAGYSFTSVSKEAFEAGNIRLGDFLFIDLIMGAEKETVCGRDTIFETFTPDIVNQLNKYILSHGNILITGQYITSDAEMRSRCDTTISDFIEKKLHCKWAGQSNKGTNALTSKISFDLRFKEKYNFYDAPNGRIYFVSNPDILLPTNDGQTVLRYEDSNDAACVMYKGRYRSVAMAIPFETIKTQTDRDEFMSETIKFFAQSKYWSDKKTNMSPNHILKGKNYTTNKSRRKTK